MTDDEAARELLRYPESHRITHYPSPDGMMPLTPVQALAQTDERWRQPTEGEIRPRLLPRQKPPEPAALFED